MPAGQPPDYPPTDLQALLTFQDRTLEQRSPTAGPVTLTTPMWSVNELVGYLQFRLNRFLRETGLVVARSGYDGSSDDNSIAVTPTVQAVALPQNMVDLLRLAYINKDTATPPAPKTITEVPREDVTSLDGLDSSWETTDTATPTGYTQSITDTLQAFLAHPPTDVGAVDLTFVAVAQTLTGAGVSLNLPSVVAFYPLYGMAADAYSKEGEANNPQLAAYFDSRYEEGIFLAKCLLSAPSRAEAGTIQ